ncbi:MAG: ATP-binding cassette domain-containing protein [Alphaproteobacteria bacterium]|nr:MAG: ATP-binding cassette domain-containing protein [Alphaproteobacteria bacterium]
MIRCEDLVYGYEKGPQYRAHGVFKEASVTTITGENGSGKTTFLHALAGIVPLHSGKIFYGPNDITRKMLENRGVYLVFAHGNLFPGLTVQQNLAVAGGGDMELVHHLLASYDAENLSVRYPRDLSSGEKQLISLLRTRLVPHSAILLDEPLNYLSLDRARQVRSDLVDLARHKRKTIIMVSHQLKLGSPDAIEHCVCIDKLVECLRT